MSGYCSFWFYFIDLFKLTCMKFICSDWLGDCSCLELLKLTTLFYRFIYKYLLNERRGVLVVSLSLDIWAEMSFVGFCQ